MNNYNNGNITKENEMGGECGRQGISQKSEIKRKGGGGRDLYESKRSVV